MYWTQQEVIDDIKSIVTVSQQLQTKTQNTMQNASNSLMDHSPAQVPYTRHPAGPSPLILSYSYSNVYMYSITL